MAECGVAQKVKVEVFGPVIHQRKRGCVVTVVRERNWQCFQLQPRGGCPNLHTDSDGIGML